MKTVSSQWMREAVEAAYRQLGLPTGWSSEQTERFLSLVTERLDAKAAQLSMDLAEDAISRWRTAHPGQDPDHQTTVGLHETALENAREAVVREELYALMAAPAQDQAETASRPSPEVSWEDRWRDIRYRTEPSEAVEDLVDRVWPQRSAMFRVKAAYLLATRAEEGRPVPTSPRHHLVPRLTALVEEELRADGYPIE
ncbi:hypothetical protein [Mycobacterium sp. IDR2000157661]|uniref:hypothetical protein n=1 Tax=Mycobacterium sp. IDR2000157661 TaxID=2867005 RepID=UPI001EEB2D47|nr:hypothetical protein [Mycobacterium sp. IDR2000157661]